ncbi:23S rRNA (adenine(2030)-N(6))-methyltransferase RlmJ [Solimonas fluminis]|uniref:Ribosomal RNA large subunit methyltransferase J n=1 Tax=Solimonas fluminis TaxID=2086571 RepID=A0A2S5TFU9_9GAMM|nr:23S rRNA (adenine(2030)-N(6))-methyltransferase RlmJ [Solimonas fluminis]PPE73829.1 23S rRNA (adenine(2030)-N(6))-methyltransferase RlmJ [Solimonas fluminis]
MHYQHRYHAGNFADVFKHVLLCGLLRALSRKDKPWRLLDTHAGSGLYDLGDEAAERTGEYRDGIGRLANATGLPAPVRDYLELVRGFGGRYPGSPLLGLACAREQDRVAACEKVPAVFAQLKAHAGGDPRAQLHQRDGYESHALLPPPEKRGLVLVDPPFERPDEFDAISAYLKKASARFAGGVHAVWYPVKNRHEADRFRRRLMREHPRSGVDLQLHNGAEAEGQMRACGLCVLNPPYGWASEMEPALRWLARELAQGPRAEHLVEAWEAAAA